MSDQTIELLKALEEGVTIGPKYAVAIGEAVRRLEFTSSGCDGEGCGACVVCLDNRIKELVRNYDIERERAEQAEQRITAAMAYCDDSWSNYEVTQEMNEVLLRLRGEQ